MQDFDLLSWAGHSLSWISILGVVIGWLPSVAVLLAILWYVLQIWDSRHVQTWISNRRVRKLAKLKIEMARLTALELIAHPVHPDLTVPAKDAAESLLETARLEARKIVETALAAAAAQAKQADKP
jgi:hypothetical protein